MIQCFFLYVLMYVGGKWEIDRCCQPESVWSILYGWLVLKDNRTIPQHIIWVYSFFLLHANTVNLGLKFANLRQRCSSYSLGFSRTEKCGFLDFLSTLYCLLYSFLHSSRSSRTNMFLRDMFYWLRTGKIITPNGLARS